MIRATGVKRSIYLFAVLEGATVMAVELLSARMVAPYFGSSLYVWATVIGFTLLALAIGYFVGGIIADKYRDPDTLLWVLLIASFFLMLMHVSAPLLTIAFVKIDPGVAVILVSMVLILPPLTFMGMVPPILIRKVSATVDHAGRSTGVVYAISSASGIIALPLFGFFIIPRLGLTLPSILVGAVVGLIPFLELISRKKYMSLLFIPFVLFSFWTIKAVRPGKDVDVRYYSEGLLGQLLVTDVSNHHGKQVNVRLLFVNRIGQTGVDQDTLKPTGADIYYVSSVCSRRPKKSNALILGLGGGSIASILNNLEFKVDAVELDQRVAEVARQYFALSDNVNVIVDDARHYLEETQKKYDVILFDVYRGELPPPHVFTLESLIRAKSLLKEDGLIVVNFNGFLEGKPGLPARSIYKTLLAAGLEARILPTPGAVAERSIVLVASMKKQDFHAVRGALSLKNEKPANLETLFLDPRELDLNDAVVLTDDRPILELLNIPAGNTWRKVHIPFTRMFYEEGVPLFK